MATWTWTRWFGGKKPTPVDPRAAEFRSAIRWHDVATLQRLVRNGLDVNATTPDAWHTYLHEACRANTPPHPQYVPERGGWWELQPENWLRTVVFLLEAGANPNALDSHKNTTMMSLVEDDYAWSTWDPPADPGTVAKSFHFKAASALMRRGHDRNLRDNRGRTALHLAADTSVNWDPYVADGSCAVAMLLALGFDVNATDEDGRTPLDLAGRHEPYKAAALLKAATGGV